MELEAANLEKEGGIQGERGQGQEEDTAGLSLLIQQIVESAGVEEEADPETAMSQAETTIDPSSLVKNVQKRDDRKRKRKPDDFVTPKSSPKKKKTRAVKSKNDVDHPVS